MGVLLTRPAPAARLPGGTLMLADVPPHRRRFVLGAQRGSPRAARLQHQLYGVLKRQLDAVRLGVTADVVRAYAQLAKAAPSSRVNAILRAVKDRRFYALREPVEAILAQVAQLGVRTAVGTIRSDVYGPSLINVRGQPIAVDVAVPNDAVTSWAQQRAARLVGMRVTPNGVVPNPNPAYAISTTTRNMLRGTITKALAEGWSVTELRRALQAQYAFSATRANMIARTELAAALIQGNIAAYEANATPTKKQWLLADTHPKPDVCDENAAQGVIDWGEPFESGDDQPPAHPYCLCDLLIEPGQPAQQPIEPVVETEWEDSTVGAAQALGVPVQALPQPPAVTAPDPLVHEGLYVAGDLAGFSTQSRLLPDGTIYTTSVEDAARALYRNRKVELDQPRQITVVLDRLQHLARVMEIAGEKAPFFNLCNVMIAGTSLFCAEAHGIPRVKMPQLKGPPEPGSRADREGVKDVRGEVDTTEWFKDYLRGLGATISEDTELLAAMKATQNQLVPKNVSIIAQAAREGKLAEARLFLSRDNYIVDGHHRWAALVALDSTDNVWNTRVPIYRVDMGIIELLAHAKRFAASVGIPQSAATTPMPPEQRLLPTAVRSAAEPVADVPLANAPAAPLFDPRYPVPPSLAAAYETTKSPRLQAQDAIRLAATGGDKAVKITVSVADDPMSIKAANALATVLDRMRAEGYPMPGKIRVVLAKDAEEQGPGGEVTVSRAAATRRKIGTGEAILASERQLEIVVPTNAPLDALLDALDVANMKRIAAAEDWPASKAFVGRTFGELIVHEIGHVYHPPGSETSISWGFAAEDAQFRRAMVKAGILPARASDADFSLLEQAARGVSWYGSTNPREFIAEAFTRLYAGEKLPPKMRALYDALGGLQPLKRTIAHSLTPAMTPEEAASSDSPRGATPALDARAAPRSAELFDMRQALERYRITYGYEAINALMRGERWQGAAYDKEMALRDIELLRQAFDEPSIARTLAEPGTVFRGISSRAVYDELVNKRRGAIYSDKAFMSTTRRIDLASIASRERYGEPEVLLAIRAPKGTTYLAGERRESELILRPESRLRVLRIDRTPGARGEPPRLYVEMELVPEPADVPAGAPAAEPAAAPAVAARTELTPSQELDEMRARIKAVAPNTELDLDSRSPNRMAAARIVTDRLVQMASEGYDLPPHIVIAAKPEGTAWGTSETKAGTIVLRLPKNLPVGADLDKAVKRVFARPFNTTESFEDILVHEMGHMEHLEWRWTNWLDAAHVLWEGGDDEAPVPPDFANDVVERAGIEDAADFGTWMEMAARKVSVYATRNTHEFLAETFTDLYRGRYVAKEPLALYGILGGKLPRGVTWESALARAEAVEAEAAAEAAAKPVVRGLSTEPEVPKPEVVSAALGVTRSLTQELEQAREAVKVASGGRTVATVEAHPNAVRAAEAVADVVRELLIDGYPMPASLAVTSTRFDLAGPGGLVQARGLVPQLAPSGMSMEIALPAHLPLSADLDRAVKLGHGRRTTAREFRDVVLHEFGHVYNGIRYMSWNDAFQRVLSPGRTITGDAVAQAIEAAKRVSPYAAKEPDEFLAEMFVKLYRGDRVPVAAMRLYTKLGGKKPLPKRRAKL